MRESANLLSGNGARYDQSNQTKSLGFFPWTEKSNVIEDNTFFENNIVTEYKGTHKYSPDYYKKIPEITVERVYREILEILSV